MRIVPKYYYQTVLVQLNFLEASFVTETSSGSGPRSLGLRLAVPRRGCGDQRTQKVAGRGGDSVNGKFERRFVAFGGFVEARQLSNELQRAARISSSVAGGSKLNRILMLRHI
jgi:hypothetical protein